MLRYSTSLYIFIKNDRYFSLLTINIIRVMNNNLHPQRYRLLEVPGIPKTSDTLHLAPLKECKHRDFCLHFICLKLTPVHLTSQGSCWLFVAPYKMLINIPDRLTIIKQHNTLLVFIFFLLHFDLEIFYTHLSHFLSQRQSGTNHNHLFLSSFYLLEQ